jgi:hypothetical protein
MDVCKEFGLNPTEIQHGFADKGVKADLSQTIKDIAAVNKMEPMAVFEIIRDAVDPQTH